MAKSIETEAVHALPTVQKGVASNRLTLRDRLSRLTIDDACRLLGARGQRLLTKSGGLYEFDPEKHCRLGDDLFRVRIPGERVNGKPIIVSITLRADARQRLLCNCNACDQPCEHLGAVLGFVLESKTPLGLAAPPQQLAPADADEQQLIDQAIHDRAERARTEKMVVKATDARRLWSDYLVTNRVSGKTYRVALRGVEPGDSFCSCPDFRTNTLGTCKHIIKVLSRVRRKFPPAALKRPWRADRLSLHLRYDHEVSLRLVVPEKLADEAAAVVLPVRDRAITDIPKLMGILARLDQLGHSVHVYPDAEEFIEQQLFQRQMSRLTADIRQDPAHHPLRESLLKVPLLPYQLDGIAFAVGAGRAILADEMGLGKTIQAVGVAELLAKEAGISKVLVICPASLKSQWRSEIHKFCDRTVQLVGGAHAERTSTYQNESFFTICNYEQVVRDVLAIERTAWDLIILDEGQRIKNWETRTARVVKTLKSRFALLLSGTPLENRLDDLYSVVQFVDDRRLGPGFRFFHRHRLVDGDGKLVGYQRLDELRTALADVLLRRTRDSVRLQLPERTLEIVRIAPTDEQLTLHQSFMQIVRQIADKPYLTEMDLLRLRKALLMARMSADSTFLVDKQPPGFSSKLECLDELLGRLCDEPDRKVVVFSEWTTMLDQIEKILHTRKLKFTRLDGQVPQRERAALVAQFQDDPECRLFLTTNAGSTGLNLQSANTVVNVDLPWNPAVLEQRIARAHRMGQKREVQVYVLVTEGTIEEGLLSTIAKKKELAIAALDADSDVSQIDLVTGREDLKQKLEVLLGAVPAAPLDASQGAETVAETAANVSDASGASESSPGETSAGEVAAASAGNTNPHRERVAAAGGELLGAAFKFLGELVAQQQTPEPPSELVGSLRAGLGHCVEPAVDGGRPVLRFTLPDASALEGLAQTLARLLVASSPPAAPASRIGDHLP